MRLTRRFIIQSLDNVNINSPIRYERYYINDNLRIQSKNNILEKEILDKYKGLIRVEVKFKSTDEMNSYKIESWMEAEITNSPLAFDKYLSKLSEQEFLLELNKYIRNEINE